MPDSYTKIVYGISLLLISGASYSSSTITEDNKKTVVCTEPRPQMCTQEYSPVCAERFNGIQCIKAPCPASEKKHYSNGCMACGDKQVISYTPGPCIPSVEQ